MSRLYLKFLRACLKMIRGKIARKETKQITTRNHQITKEYSKREGEEQNNCKTDEIFCVFPDRAQVNVFNMAGTIDPY